MNNYYAIFRKKNEVLTRELTRIYFNPVNPSEKDNKCIAVVVAKNPGAAKPKVYEKWGELELGTDKTLPIIYNSFKDAFEKAKYNIPLNGYVRVLNLFSVCNVDIDIAYQDLLKIEDKIKFEKAESDLETSRFIFMAWGNEPYLDSFRSEWIKFLTPFAHKSFYFSYLGKPNDQFPCDGVPSLNTNVKHPIGLDTEKLKARILNYF